MKVVSTFAGMGGSSFGYEQAGLDVVGAIEFQEDIAEVYRLNHPARCLVVNVRDVSGAGLIAEFGNFHVLDGSPPCQAFSSLNSGKTLAEKTTEGSHGDGSYQRSDDLVWDWARLVVEVMPQYAVMENVAMLAHAKHRAWLWPAFTALQAAGYHLSLQILRAEGFGNPSSRKRMVLLASRDEPWDEYEWPLKPMVPASVAFPDEAVGIVEKAKEDRGFRFRPITRPCPVISSVGMAYGARGETAVIIDDGLTHDPITGSTLLPKKWMTEMRVAAGHRPMRKFHTREIERLMSMPEVTWPASTNSVRAWAMVGNSVPPVLTEAVADRIMQHARKHAPETVNA